MLVCSHCGTELMSAGQACPSCGKRGAVDARFYAGEVKPAPPGSGDSLAAAPHASRSGALPDADRAWSPWLAAVVTILLGPAAGVILASRNLTRLKPDVVGPWWLASAVIAQVFAAVVCGLLGKHEVGTALLVPPAVVNVVFAALLVWLQAPHVAEQRQKQPGNHAPGVDAFGAFVAGLVLSVLLGYTCYFIADRFADKAISAKVKEIREARKAAEPLPPMMGMPPM